MLNKFSSGVDSLFYKFYFFRLSVFANYSIFSLIWNIFLAFIPVFIYQRMFILNTKTNLQKKIHKFIFWGLFFLWLLFIPNTAYLIVSIRHLINYCPFGSYQDVCLNNAWQVMFFFLNAIIGWIFFVGFLRDMKFLMQNIFTKKIGQIFIFIVIPLISLGVLLGLLHRWNSWEVFVHPFFIIKTIIVYFTDLIYFLNFLFFTFSLYLLYFVGEKLFKNKN